MRNLSFQSLKLSETTEEFHQSVCENFNTNLKQLESDVKVLKDWLKSQPHIPHCYSNTMLKCYLLACKNRMERAKEKLENYYKARAEISAYFERDPTTEQMKECAENIQMYMLPKLSSDGCRVMIAKIMSTDSKYYDPWLFAKRVLMAEDIKMNREAFTKGSYFVFDASNFTMGHALKITPQFAQQLLYCAQNVLPVIISGIVFFNAPAYLEIVLNIIRPFMKSKLFKRIHVHSSGPEVLEKYFPTAIFPKEYGGEEDITSDELNESWMKCLRENREWFLAEGQMKIEVDKNRLKEKRGKLKEMEGSFKTLCID